MTTIPFFPLRYWDMKRVIQKIFQQPSSDNERKFGDIQIDESASLQLINPKVINYFELKLAEGSYLFSKNGAHSIGHRELLDKIHEAIDTNTFYSENDTVLLQHDVDRGFAMKLCSDLSEDYERTLSKCSSQLYFEIQKF